MPLVPTVIFKISAWSGLIASLAVVTVLTLG